MLHAAACLRAFIGGQDVVLVTGGRSSPVECTADAWLARVSLDPAHAPLSWHAVRVEPQAPLRRWSHTSSCVASEHGLATVLLFGGRDVDFVKGDLIRLTVSDTGDGSAVAAVEVMSPTGCAPCPRFGHAAAVVSAGCSLLIHGGYASHSLDASVSVPVLLHDSVRYAIVNS